MHYDRGLSFYRCRSYYLYLIWQIVYRTINALIPHSFHTVWPQLQSRRHLYTWMCIWYGLLALASLSWMKVVISILKAHSFLSLSSDIKTKFKTFCQDIYLQIKILTSEAAFAKVELLTRWEQIMTRRTAPCSHCHFLFLPT